MTIDRTIAEKLIEETTTLETSEGVKVYDCKVLDNGYVIEGHTEDEQKALYNAITKKWFVGVNHNGAFLLPVSVMDEDEKKKFCALGGANSHRAQKEQKNINQLAKAMLEQTVTEEQIKQILGDNTTMLLDNSLASLMIAKGIQGALDGSFKWFETIRDTAGYRPKNEIELQADIITESDKALLDKLTNAI